jgi:hypothetical protein
MTIKEFVDKYIAPWKVLIAVVIAVLIGGYNAYCYVVTEPELAAKEEALKTELNEMRTMIAFNWATQQQYDVQRNMEKIEEEWGSDPSTYPPQIKRDYEKYQNRWKKFDDIKFQQESDGIIPAGPTG